MASEKAKSKNAAVNYVQSSVEELRKVSWPTKNKAIRLTFLVLGFCLVVAAIIGVMDLVFGIGYRTLLDLGPERSLPTSVVEETAPLEGGTFTVDEGTAGVPEIEVDLGEGTVTDGAAVEVETESADASLPASSEEATASGGESADTEAPTTETNE